MAVVDRYAEQARADFIEEVEAGTSFRVREPRDELDGRSLHEVWVAGDREGVQSWMADQYARTEAIVAAHHADAGYMARIAGYQQAAAASRVERVIRSA
jgi:hypothetical protein